MADRGFYDVYSNVPNDRHVVVRFFPDAGNAPTFVAGDNLYVSTIARTSQGLYTITLQDAYKRLCGVNVSLQINAALGVGRQVFAGPVSNVGTSSPVTATVLFTDGAGAVQDPPAANANNSITVIMVFSDIAAV